MLAVLTSRRFTKHVESPGDVSHVWKVAIVYVRLDDSMIFHYSCVLDPVFCIHMPGFH